MRILPLAPATPLATAHYVISPGHGNDAPLVPTHAPKQLPAGTTLAQAIADAHAAAAKFTLQVVNQGTRTYVNQAQAVVQAANGRFALVALGAVGHHDPKAYPALLDGVVRSVDHGSVENFPVNMLIASVTVDAPAGDVRAVVGAELQFDFPATTAP